MTWGPKLRDEVIVRWQKARWPKGLATFAIWLAEHEKHGGEVRYIAALTTTGKDQRTIGSEVATLIQSPEINGPFRYPYFILQSDAQVFLARSLIEDRITVWDFYTAKKVIK